MATGGTNKTSRADRTGSGRPSSISSSRRSPQIALKESSSCRPSERLNPKTIDPVSGALFQIIIYANIRTISVYILIYSSKTMLENNQHFQQFIAMVVCLAGSFAFLLSCFNIMCFTVFDLHCSKFPVPLKHFALAFDSGGGSSISQNKLPQLILGYVYILKYLQRNFIG